MVCPPKGMGEQFGSNLVMNAIEAMSKVGDEYLDVLVLTKDDDSRVAPVVFLCRAGRTAQAHF